MTPWEIAYHFPSKFKDYVMANFPDGKMPAAKEATHEGASPPTSTKSPSSFAGDADWPEKAKRIFARVIAASRKAADAANQPGISIITLDLPPDCRQDGTLYDDQKFPYPFGSAIEVSFPGRTDDLRVELISEHAGEDSAKDPDRAFRITAYNFMADLQDIATAEWDWATAWASTPQAAAWVVEAFAWQIHKKGKPANGNS